MNKIMILALLFIRVAFAADPLTQPIPNQNGFDTMDMAATEALKECIKLSTKFEYGGVILEWNGKFYFTNPITSKSDKEIGTFRIAFYKGSKVVGLYHTHPPGFNSDIFSSSDVKFADDKSWVSYIAVINESKSRVLRYTPGKTSKEIKHHLITEGEVSDGDPVSAI
jgi:proteasome lid subunit RPN8/RPN11